MESRRAITLDACDAADGGGNHASGSVPLTSARHGQGGSGSGKYSPLYAVVRVPAGDDTVST